MSLVEDGAPPVEVAVEWVQVDGFGDLSDGFRGTFEQLRAHLLHDLPEGDVTDPLPGQVYVRSLVATVSCPLVVLTTPWCSQRWIPRPEQRPPRWSSWLLRR